MKIKNKPKKQASSFGAFEPKDSINQNGLTVDKSPEITQRPKISFELSIRARKDFTEKQKNIIDT